MPGTVHSIHFPAPDAPVNDGRSVARATRRPLHPIRKPARKAAPINMMECFASALRDIEITREKLRDLVNSGSRHGDLQVALSAARRLEASLQALINAEGES